VILLAAFHLHANQHARLSSAMQTDMYVYSLLWPLSSCLLDYISDQADTQVTGIFQLVNWLMLLAAVFNEQMHQIL